MKTVRVYSEPQIGLYDSAGMNVLSFPEGPKATDLSAGAQAGVNLWYGVYARSLRFCETFDSCIVTDLNNSEVDSLLDKSGRLEETSS